MNEYDEYAVEQAVQLKEQHGGSAELTVLSIGPDRVKEAMKKALAMGCDRGVHIKDDESYRKDPFEIASIIAEFAREKGFDLIFTGMQSQDRGSAQVGVLVAEMLELLSVTTVVDFAFDEGTVTAKRELEGGLKAVVKMPTAGAGHLPARPQHPALSDPAQHHEGQEEGALSVVARRPAQGRASWLETVKVVLPREKGRRDGARRGGLAEAVPGQD